MLKRVAHSFGLVEHKEKGSRRKNHCEAAAAPELYSPSKDFVVRIIHAGGYQELYRHAVPASKLMAKYPGMCVARPEVFRVPHESVLWHEEVLLPGHKYILISFRDVEKLKRKLFEEGKVNGEVQAKVKVPNGVAGHEALDEEIHSGHSYKENGKVQETNGVAEKRVVETSKTVSPKGQRNSSVEEIVDSSLDSSLSEGGVENSFFSAKDFYVPREKSTTTFYVPKEKSTITTTTTTTFYAPKEKTTITTTTTTTTTKPSRRKGIKGKKPFAPPLPKQRPYRSLGWKPSLSPVKELSP